MRISINTGEKLTGRRLLGVVVGALLVVTGFAVPALTLIESIRVVPPSLMQSLLTGATLFKLGLIILGLTVALLSFVYDWQADVARTNVARAAHQPDSKTALIVLGGLLLAASALRFYSLDAGLWHDEISAYLEYARLPFGEIITFYDSENQHILYSVAAHFSFMLFGESGWALRIPAALFGVGSIGALYLLGRRVANTRETLLAAGLLTFSYHHIWFSQNARGYTAMLFFTLLAAWLLLRAIDETRLGTWLAFAGASALGVYAHLTMVFVVLGYFIVYLWLLWSRRSQVWPNRWAGLFWGFGLAGLLTFQLYALVLPQVLSGLKGTVSVVAEWRQPLWTMLELLNGLELSFAGGLLAIVALLVAGAGLVSYARQGPILLQMLIIPPAIGTLAVAAAGHHLWPRFYFFAFGFAALVAVRGAMVSGQAVARVVALSPRWAMSVGTLVAIAMILVSAKSLPYVYAPKQDYAGALAYVQSEAQPGDSIVTVGLATYTYQKMYKLDWPQVKSVAELNAVRARAKRTWVLYTLAPQAISVYPELMQNISQNFKIAKEFYGSVGDGAIFVCLADGPVSTSEPSSARLRLLLE